MKHLEDYLKTIYVLSRTVNGSIKSSDIASKLELTRGAVSSMVQKLAKKGYLLYSPYQGVELTPLGREYGHRMLRRHRLIELYLQEQLSVPLNAVHEEAESLEHAVSDFLVDQMDKVLCYPEFDPHGDPIPQKDGSFPSHEDCLPLADCQVADSVKIVRFICDESHFLSYLADNHIHLNTVIKVSQMYSFDDSMDIVFDVSHCMQKKHLSAFDTQHIWVVPTPKEIKKC